MATRLNKFWDIIGKEEIFFFFFSKNIKLEKKDT